MIVIKNPRHIIISSEVANKLKKMGTMVDSYDTVIRTMIYKIDQFQKEAIR